MPAILASGEGIITVMGAIFVGAFCSLLCFGGAVAAHYDERRKRFVWPLFGMGIIFVLLALSSLIIVPILCGRFDLP